MSTQVVEPLDAAGAAAALCDANATGRSVSVRGAATKFAPPVSDVMISTTKMTAGVDHVAGDLVATLPAGISLEAANDVLRREKQWLPLDPPRSDRATIGGIVAANDSGPRRHRFGAPRDLIIGIEIALVDGRIAKAGGRVVKNVAGYDLSKLMCGSLGTLAVVTRATFKLSPLAPFSQTLVATGSDLRRLSTLALTLANAPPLSPTAIELQSPPHRLLVRFETTESAAAAQAKIAAGLCEQFGATTHVVSGQAEVDAWRAHEGRIFGMPGTVVKVAVLPTDVADLLAIVQRLTSAAGVECELSGRAALGIVLLRLGGDPAAHAAIVGELRREAGARSGSAVVVSAAGDDLFTTADRWGSVGDAEPLMRAVKARFDPHHILNAGLTPWD
jgi:glycolate oxidase FAD binding subunit